ncbi:hypothetical protein WLU28_00170 [Bordetella bronchiseptica]
MTATNISRFKEDITKLAHRGDLLLTTMQYERSPKAVRAAIKKAYPDKVDEYIAELKPVAETYQAWYSEARALLRQVLPDRLDDFTRHYEKPKGRKIIGYESYRIEDYLQDLRVTRGYDETVVDPSAALPHLQQQVAIVKAAAARFDSSLFDIKALVQADMFDTEIDAAEALAKHKFVRAAGALAGVVLERHLAQVCENRTLSIGKKNPTISDFNELLKSNEVIGVPEWRFVQHLADIRNQCDHSRNEPTADQVNDLIAGVKKVIKTVY